MPALLHPRQALEGLCGCLPAKRVHFKCRLLWHSSALCPWLTPEDSLQCFIAAWELLAQCALLFLLDALLPDARGVLCVRLRCDNAASEAASWKGLSMATGLCHVLEAFFRLQRRTRLEAVIEHVPGFINTIADGLSRGSVPEMLGLPPDCIRPIPWGALLAPHQLRVFPEEVPLSRVFPRAA